MAPKFAQKWRNTPSHRRALEIVAETTRRDLGLIANSDVSRFYRENGTFKAIHEIDADDRRAISRAKSFILSTPFGR